MVANHRILRQLVKIICSIFILAIMYAAIRVFICDSFVVKGHSMEPVLYSGDRVYVSKLRMGARIYLDYDFSKTSLSSFRMPGLSSVNIGDIVVMNYPYAKSDDTITFKINLVYVKRCYGVPGDTVRISNGFYLNPRTGGKIGDQSYQRILSVMPDSVLLGSGVKINIPQQDVTRGWTIRNFGPMYVPRKGDVVDIDVGSYKLWQRQILYETGNQFVERDGKVYIGNTPIRRYTFRTNWYFLGGDNVLNSRDSRYFGLVPEEYIVGIVIR